MSNLTPTPTALSVACDPSTQPTLEMLAARVTQLGGLDIRRLLPRRRRRLVGPWCFFDSFGPIVFESGKPMDVPPHPHIGLQTVSWLIEGEVLHKDSLGLEGLARPGVVNLMTAGQGIAHAEETPPGGRGRLRGVQLWVALPDAHREVAPAFEQPTVVRGVEIEGGQATVFLGSLCGALAGGRTFSPLVGAELAGGRGRRLVVPLNPDFEHALVLLDGECALDGQPLATETLCYLGSGRRELCLTGGESPPRALLLGGAPFGEEILMWWNFVARTTDEIAAAREDWQAGRRFGEVEAYSGKRLDAPPFLARPVPGG